MGPQVKKRKLQAASSTPAAGPAPKRSKNHRPASKKTASASAKSKAPPRRAVDAAALAWKPIDEEEFGGLQVIDNVDVVKDGNKVQFLVRGEQQLAGDADGDKNDDDDDDEGESFEGFGDDPVEGADVDPRKAGNSEDGLEAAGDEEPPAGRERKQKQKEKKQKKQNAAAADAQLLAKTKVQKSSARGNNNSFSALAGDGAGEAEDDGVDVAAWAALNLSPRILSAIAKLGFSKPTKIQEEAIPDILTGEDVIGKAQTGSGKTLAFGIPIVERWLDEHDSKQIDEDGDEAEKKKSPMALVLSPTRELAKQLGDHLTALCEGLPSAPYVCVITGGLSIQKQQRQLAKADIVIGTPGRLWEVLEGDAKLQDTFTRIQFLVVDEADRLFKAGQFKEAQDIIGALDKKEPDAGDDSEDEDVEDLPPRQTLVFSATFDKELQTKLAGSKRLKKKGAEEDKMEYLMKSLKFRKEPKFIDVNPVRQMAEGLKEGLIECGAMEKDLHLYTALLLNPKRRILVFTNSISAVRRLTPFLQNLTLNALPLHSQMPQKARLRSLERFTEASKNSILVATDVAARGLDIPEVDMVLHYHVPRAADTYVHRSGRTARGDRTGVSVLLCAPDEVLPTRRLAGKVHAEAAREHVIQTLPLDRKIAARLKPRADLAKKLADAALAKEKARGDDSFMRNAAEELGVEYDSDDDTFDIGWGGRGGGRKRKEKAAREMSKAEMGALRVQLKAELAKRVNLGVSERYITGGRVDVAALLREREAGQTGLFLGGDGQGLGFDL